MTGSVLALLLADARFPAGSHAHSGGVEQAVDDGMICDEVGLASFVDGRLATAQIEVESWLKGLADSAVDWSQSAILERLGSPFQSSGKRLLFLTGTDLIKRAKKRVALVAKTPIPQWLRV